MTFKLNPKNIKLDVSSYKGYLHLLLLGILSLATFLYLYKIGEESLWTDEFYSIADAKLVPDEVSKIRPVYYIVLRVWMLFGENDIWLRMLSVPFALGSVFLIYLIGKRLLGTYVGIVSALLLTLSPLFINHAQEIRMYTLSTFLGLLGTFFILKLLEKPKTASLIGWIGFRILAILTTPLNILLLLPDTIILIYQYRHRGRLIAALAGILLALLVLSFPWLEAFYNASLDFFGAWTSSIPKPGITNILSRLTNFTAYWPLRSLESDIGIKFYKVYTLLILLTIFASVYIKRKKKRGVYYLAIFLILPSSILFILSWMFSYVWIPRYLLMVAPYLLLLISAGFTAIKEWQPKLAAVLAIVYFLAVGGGLQAYYSKQLRSDWRSAVEFISKQDQTDDVIALASSIPRSSSILSHYYDGTSQIYTVDMRDVNAQLPEFESRLWVIYKPFFYTEDSAVDQFRQDIFDEYYVEDSKKFVNESGWNKPIEVFLLRNKGAK